MKITYLISLVGISVLTLSGCATIMKGRSQVVSINSNVKDAEITIDGKVVGRTPYNGPIERGSDTSVTLSKAGYESKTVVLNTEFENVFWGNIILGGSFGSSTDYGTGAMYKYSPATINIDIVKSGK
ncbi:MAG: PEGA domain-containing protein [Bdellovibrionota bacterium]